MSIVVRCGACGAKYNIAAAMAGKMVRCKKCGAIFNVPAERDAAPDEPDLSSVAADDDSEESGSPAPTPAPSAAPRRPRVLPPVSHMPREDPDDVFDQAGAEEGAGGSTYAPNPAFAFPASHLLDLGLPILTFIVAIGWMIVEAVRADNFGLAWLGHLRWFLYLAAYAFIVYPLTILGVHRVGKKLHFGMPAAHPWKVFAVFTLPFMLGAIFSLKDGSAAMVISGLVVGLCGALAMFWFEYRLRPWQTSLGLGLVAAYHSAGVILAIFLGFAINAVVFSSMEKTRTAYKLGRSPLAPVLPWNPTAPDPEPKRRPLAIATSTQDSSTQPTTQQAVTETTKPTTEPVAINTSVDIPNPDKRMTIDPIPKPADPATQPATQPVPVTPAPAFVASAFVASTAPETSLGEFDDIIYSNLGGTNTALVLRSRGPMLDVVELWNTQPFEKKSTIPVPHPRDEKVAYWLGPKGAAFAHLVNFPSKAIAIHSTLEDKILRTIELDTTRTGTPELIGFAANNQIGVLWESSGAFGVELFETVNGQRTRQIPLPSFLRARGNLGISPDGRYLASAIRASIPVKADGAPRPDLPAPALEPRATILLTDVSAARVAPRLLPIPAMSVEKLAVFSSLLFSTDSQKLSMLFEENGNALVVSWKPPETRQIAQSIIFGCRPANASPDYHGSALDQLPGASSWLLYGNTIVQADHIVGDLGVVTAKGHQFLNRDTLAIAIPTESGKMSMLIVKLNLEKFPSSGGKEPPKVPIPVKP